MSKNQSTTGATFVEALKSLFSGLMKLMLICSSWLFKITATITQKLGDLFDDWSKK